MEIVTPNRGACDRPDNLVVNCGFDSSYDGWAIYTGESWRIVPDDGSTKLGSLELASWALLDNDFESVSIRQCVTVPREFHSYDFGGQIKLVSGTVDNCVIHATQLATDDCSGNGIVGPAGEGFLPGADWTPAPHGRLWTISPSELRALLISVTCVKPEGPEFTVRFDDFYLIETDEPRP